MFGIDSPELLVIAVVALVVIGPKELPGLLRTWGKWMSQMRGMASEFRGHVDEMVRQSELDEVKKQLEGSAAGLDLQSLDPTKQIKQHIQEGMAEGEKALARPSRPSTIRWPSPSRRRRSRPSRPPQTRGRTCDRACDRPAPAVTAEAAPAAIRSCPMRQPVRTRRPRKTRQGRGRIGQLAL